jgi:predicted metalloprotease with PDZ domain
MRNLIAVTAALLAAPIASAAACPNCTLVHYTVTVAPADSLGLAVEMRINQPTRPLRLAFAADPEYPESFAGNVRGISASAGSRPVRVTRESQDVWRIDDPGHDVTLHYRVALRPPSPNGRGSWTSTVRSDGALIRPHATFLYMVGQTKVPHSVRLAAPATWQATAALRRSADGPNLFTAPSFDSLVDAPIMLGRPHSWRFDAGGVPHHVVYWPRPSAPAFDTAAFVGGIERLTGATLALFGRAPYADYTFLYQDEAWGALEHANSLTIGVSSDDLAKDPLSGLETTAHEFLHSWNLVRLRPRGTGGVSYQPRPRSPLSWWSEGVTVYYANLLQLRAGLLTDSAARAQLAYDVARYVANPAHGRVSPEDAGRTGGVPARNDGYSPDYYVQGTMIGAALDATIRASTAGRRSLDDAMRTLYARHAGPAGYTSADVEAAATEACGCALHAFFERHVRGAAPVDLAPYLARVGMRLTMVREPATGDDGRPRPDLRVNAHVEDGDTTLRLFLPDPSGAWGRAGLRAGDEIRAIDGAPLRTTADFRATIRARPIGSRLAVDYVRAGRPAHAIVTLSGYERTRATIEPDPRASPVARALGAGWLRSAA